MLRLLEDHKHKGRLVTDVLKIPEEGLHLFYIKTAAETGTTGG